MKENEKMEKGTEKQKKHREMEHVIYMSIQTCKN